MRASALFASDFLHAMLAGLAQERTISALMADRPNASPGPSLLHAIGMFGALA